MYFVLCPFLYYMANKNYIEDFIAIETNGCSTYTLDRKRLKNLIIKFIDQNSHGVDENCKTKYVDFIYSHLSVDRME